MSFAQEWGLVALSQKGALQQTGNTGFAFSLTGELDVTALERSINDIIGRHEILRTAFRLSPDVWQSVTRAFRTRRATPVLRVAASVRSNVSVNIQTLDLQQLAPAEQFHTVATAASSLYDVRFDYSSPPLLRVLLATLSVNTHWLILVVSHLIFDGLSRTIFHEELTALYKAHMLKERSPLPSLPRQFSDFAYWQRRQFSTEDRMKFADYWNSYYREYPPLSRRHLQKGADCASPKMALSVLKFHTESASHIRVFVRQQRITLFTCFFTTLGVVLHLYTGQTRFGLATHFSNRTHPDIEHLIGDFATAYIVGFDLSGDPSVAELFYRVHVEVERCVKYSCLPPSLLSWYLSDASVGTTKNRKPSQLPPP